MRTLRFLSAAVVVAVLLGACSAPAPGWTYAPAPSATPLPSVSPSGSAAPSGSVPASPSASPSAPASPSASASASASASGGGGEPVEIEAQNIAFTTTEVTAPAGQPFQILFKNQDAGVPHNVEIKDQAGASLFQGQIVDGVAETTYDAPALQAGPYQFICTVHPNMTGTLTAG